MIKYEAVIVEKNGKKSTLEEFRDACMGGPSRTRAKDACTWLIVENEDGEELFYAEWTFLDCAKGEEIDDIETKRAYKAYIEGEKEYINFDY